MIVLLLLATYVIVLPFIARVDVIGAAQASAVTKPMEMALDGVFAERIANDELPSTSFTLLVTRRPYLILPLLLLQVPTSVIVVPTESLASTNSLS